MRRQARHPLYGEAGARGLRIRETMRDDSIKHGLLLDHLGACRRLVDRWFSATSPLIFETCLRCSTWTRCGQFPVRWKTQSRRPAGQRPPTDSVARSRSSVSLAPPDAMCHQATGVPREIPTHFVERRPPDGVSATGTSQAANPAENASTSQSRLRCCPAEG